LRVTRVFVVQSTDMVGFDTGMVFLPFDHTLVQPFCIRIKCPSTAVFWYLSAELLFFFAH